MRGLPLSFCYRLHCIIECLFSMSCLQLSHFALHHKLDTLHQIAGELSTALLDWEQPLVLLGGQVSIFFCLDVCIKVCMLYC